MILCSYWPVCLSVYLGLVPVLRFLHVLEGDGLILSPDVPKSSSQIRPGGTVHLHLQLLGLDTHLYVLDFLSLSQKYCHKLKQSNQKHFKKMTHSSMLKQKRLFNCKEPVYPLHLTISILIG